METTSSINEISKLNNRRLKTSPEHVTKNSRQRFVQKLAKINYEFRQSHNLNKNEEKPKVYKSMKLPKQVKDERMFEVTPNEIIFKDVSPGQIYQMKVVVKNKTETVRRIRVFQPKTPEFRCDYEMAKAIAPGLTIELIVSFEATKAGEFRDEIQVISDDYSYAVPMYAYSPTSKIIFEPFINMGFIQIGTEKSETIVFKNEGNDRGRVELSTGDSELLVFEPRSVFSLDPGEVKKIRVTFKATEAGIFRGVVEVHTNGKSFLKTIDINATAVDFMQFVIDSDGKELKEVDFGTILFGQGKKRKGFLVNNSPQKLYFNINYVKGHFDNYEEENNIRSPHEIGQEMTQRILSIEPSMGEIESYSQIPITFVCKTHTIDNHIIWTKNYCLSKSETEADPILENYQYTSIIFFSTTKGQGEEQETNDLTKVLKMTALGTCPQVYLSEGGINFGQVSLDSTLTRPVTIYNDSPNSIFVECPNMSHFHTNPKKLRMKAGEAKQILVEFGPKNLGKIKIDTNFIVNRDYNLLFRLEGTGMAKKISESVMIKSSKFRVGSKKKKAGLMRSQLSLKTDDYKNLPKLNLVSKSVNSIDYLKQSRLRRARGKKNKALNRQLLQMDEKIKEVSTNFFSKSKPGKQRRNKKLPNKKLDPMNHEDLVKQGDIKFLFNPNMDGLESPRINNPEEDKYLFVTKPIGKYEPQERLMNRLFDPDPNMKVKPLPSKVNQHGVIREINQHLDGHMLKRIHAGPKIIDFGELFVNSNEEKYFFIRNDLKGALSARVIIDEDIIKNSYEKSQVITSGQTAGFRISIRSNEIGPLSKIISYIINERHIFKFMIKAKIIRVKLQLSSHKIDIGFNDSSLKMEASEKLYLRNEGNAKAAFDWYSASPSFRFVPNSGIIDPSSQLPVTVFYKPNGIKLYEEQVCDLRIHDGNNEVVQVTGSVNETRCEVEPRVLDFGALAVSEQAELTLSLTNVHQKNSSIYYIDENELPDYVTVSRDSGKIYPQSTEKIIVRFISDKDYQLSGDIIIYIRGAKPIRVPVQADVIIPKILVYEKEFDFGKVTFGNSARLEMNIENTSPILAKVTLDLRPQLHRRDIAVECLKVEEVRENEEDPRAMKELDREQLLLLEKRLKKDKYGEGLDFEDEDEEDKLSSQSDSNASSFSNSRNSQEDSLDLEEEEEDVNYFILTLRPEKIYKFQLTFTPQNTVRYRFKLPLYLGSNQLPNSELQKQLLCESVPPKIILDPIDGVRDFKKKIISQMEDTEDSKMKITITNPDFNRPLNYYINDAALEEHRVFSLPKNEGSIPPNTALDIFIIFKPHIPGKWKYSLPLYLDKDRDNKKAEILIKGEAAYPKIMFDRRHIIMPVVPLGVESRCILRVINEGFKSVRLKIRVCDDFDILPLKAEFYDGHNTMGSKRKVVKAELFFTANEPISFTAKIEVEDDDENVWDIYCSGTSDNCILTNYYYFMRPVEEVGEITRIKEGPVIYKLETPAVSKSDSMMPGSVAMSRISNLSGADGNLGYSPIPFSKLESHTDSINFWLRENIPGMSISKFPEDVIMEYGEPLINTLNFLSKGATRKKIGMPLKFKTEPKQSTLVQKLYNQYSEIIDFLKEQGALLNHIRPEFLLAYQQLTSYMKSNEVENTHPVGNKINENQFKYLSLYSWSVLFTQILKIFYLNRVTYNKLRRVDFIEDKAKSLPKHQLNKSNLYSPAEIVLLKWAEGASFMVRRDKKQIMQFDKDIKNGIAIACLMQLYSDNSVRPLRHMKDIALNIEDIKLNMQSVVEGMAELSLNYIPEVDQLAEMDSIEGVLLLTHLFISLPFYIPKESITFECVLNETVAKKVYLTNPTQNPISYSAVLNGSDDFSIDKNSIAIDANKKEEFIIKFFSRISRPVTSRITFKGNVDGAIQAAPIVFDLKSKVIGRKSTGREEINDVKLYNVSTRYIRIANPFEKDVEFDVRLEHVRTETDRRRSPSKGYTTRKEEEFIFPSFFLLKKKKVFIKAGGYGKIKVNYIPLSFEVHMCHLILTDFSVGEIQYDIVGTPLLPSLTESIPITTDIDNNFPKNIPMSMMYKHRDEANEAIKQHLKLLSNDGLKNFVLEKITRKREVESFKVELANGEKDITTAKNFRMVNFSGDRGRSSSENIFKVHLNFRSPVKDYSCLVLLRNGDLTDVRVYEFLITVNPRPFKAAIEFNTNARVPLKQKIPVSNSTSNDLVFQVEKEEGVNGHFFQCDSTLAVLKESTAYLSVTFHPDWIYKKCQTVVLIINPSTKEKFEYELKGRSEEPLTEDHIEFKCNVGESSIKTITIPNESNDRVTYDVEYDLHGLTGDKSFSIKKKSSYTYRLMMGPSLGGVYAGSITFKNKETGHYIWYSLELESKGVRNIVNYDISSFIRKTAELDIEITNNHQDDLEYTVYMKGNYVYGDNKMTVPGKSKKNYKLTYLPLSLEPGEASVSFSNSKAGELLCRVKMKAIDIKPQKIPLFKSEVGKYAVQTIKLHNPSNKDAQVSTILSNKDNFEVFPPNFTIKKASSYDVKVKYIPNNIDIQNSGEVTFQSNNIGNWYYLVYGVGEVPTEFDEIKEVALLKKENNFVVNFTNPFKEAIILEIDLQFKRKEDKEVFELLNKRSKVSLTPGNTLQVPISYYPTEINEYRTKLVLKMSEKIKWVYPISVVTEANMSFKELLIGTVCRKKKEKRFTVELPGVRNLSSQDQFEISVTELRSIKLGVMQKWLIYLEDIIEVNEETKSLSFTLKFLPKKPFSDIGVLTILRKQGGIWR